MTVIVWPNSSSLRQKCKCISKSSVRHVEWAITKDPRPAGRVKVSTEIILHRTNKLSMHDCFEGTSVLRKALEVHMCLKGDEPKKEHRRSGADLERTKGILHGRHWCFGKERAAGQKEREEMSARRLEQARGRTQLDLYTRMQQYKVGS